MTGTLSLAAQALLLLLPSGLRPAHLSVHLSGSYETLPQRPSIQCHGGEAPWARRPRPGPRPPCTIQTLPVLGPSRPEDAPHPHTGLYPGLPLLWWLLACWSP